MRLAERRIFRSTRQEPRGASAAQVTAADGPGWAQACQVTNGALIDVCGDEVGVRPCSLGFKQKVSVAGCEVGDERGAQVTHRLHKILGDCQGRVVSIHGARFRSGGRRALWEPGWRKRADTEHLSAASDDCGTFYRRRNRCWWLAVSGVCWDGSVRTDVACCGGWRAGGAGDRPVARKARISRALRSSRRTAG